MHPALSKDAQTFLESLPAKPFQQITLTLFRLMEHPQPHDSKPLVGALMRGWIVANIGSFMTGRLPPCALRSSGNAMTITCTGE